MAINYTNPARGNTHELINRPIINNSGANQYATFLDLIKFGTLTDFINSGTTIDNWPDFFNTISAVLTSLDSSLRALETAIDNPRMCTIHWDENKGSSHVIQSDTLVVGQTFLEQEENFEDFPSVNGGGGYDTYGLFKGWYTAKTGGVGVDWDTIVPNTRETTFYGRWDTNKYTIHFENTGNSIINNKTPIYKDYSYYTLPYASNYSDNTYNYTFQGWSLTNNGSVSWQTYAKFVLTDSIIIEHAVGNVLTLYGVWENAEIQNTKTIIFVDLLGNEHPTVFEVGDSIDFTEYTYDPKTYTVTWRQDNYTIDNNAETVRVNYPFEGWYTAATGGTKMTSENTPYEQLADGTRYYARASSTPIGYTRRLIPGVYQYEYVIQSDSIYIQFPSNDPTKVSTSQYSYTFDGWYNAPDGQGGYKLPTTGTSRPRLDSITNNITYYAHFTQHEIQQAKRIYFYTAEGGSHYVDINEGESLYFDKVASVNDWDTTKDYTVTWQHSPSNYGTYVNLTSGTFTRNVRYAQNYDYPWSINRNNPQIIPRLTITSYDDLEDGDTYNMVFDDPIDPDNNSTTLVLPTTQSSPTGMSFDYWQIVGGSQVSLNYPLININSNITIRAQYKTDTYTITFTDHEYDSSIGGYNYIIRKQEVGKEILDDEWTVTGGQQCNAVLQAREGYVIPTDISDITIEGTYKNASYALTTYGELENAYCLTINEISSNINITMNVEAAAPAVTYYWYVGQTNPTTMSSITPIVTDTESPGWRLIGSTLPTYSASNKLWDANDIITTGTSLAKQYIAIPADSTACPRDGAGNDASKVHIYIQLENTTTIDGVEYKVYETEGKMRRHNLDIF